MTRVEVAPGLLPRTVWLQSSRRPPHDLPRYPLAAPARPYCRPFSGWLRDALGLAACRECRRAGGHKVWCSRTQPPVSPTALHRRAPAVFGPHRAAAAYRLRCPRGHLHGEGAEGGYCTVRPCQGIDWRDACADRAGCIRRCYETEEDDRDRRA